MRIAVISDIHSNLEALKRTLEDIKKRKVDQIICLGDTIAKGIHASECVELIKENCDIVLQGNCDEVMAIKQAGEEKLPTIEQERRTWNRSMLTQEQRQWLAGLPFCYEMYLSGSFIRMFHASPNRNNQAVINQDNFATKFAMFEPSERTLSKRRADVVLYGHIHHQYMDKLYNRTLINVGSVGNSFNVIRNPEKDANILETTQAYYVILEGKEGKKEYQDDFSIQFIHVPYDIQKELEYEEKNIEKEDYRHEIKEGKYRNMTKIYDNFERLGIKRESI